MRIKSILFSIFVISHLNTQMVHAESCELSAISDAVSELNEAMIGVTGELSTKVMGIKVNYDGTGSVKVLTDDSGNLIGVRLDYKDSKGVPMQQTRSIEEFNKGESVAFEMAGQKNNPLILKAKSGTTISKDKGGAFTFSLLTSKDPVKYVHYPLDLVKVSGAWKVKKADKVVTNTTIAPNISFFSWDGTFKNATFQ